MENERLVSEYLEAFGEVYVRGSNGEMSAKLHKSKVGYVASDGSSFGFAWNCAKYLVGKVGTFYGYAQDLEEYQKDVVIE